MFELFRAAKLGVVPVPAGGRASLIHVEDLARLLLALIPAGPRVNGACFEPDDGVPGGWANADLARAIGAAMGRRVAVLNLPPPLRASRGWTPARAQGQAHHGPRGLHDPPRLGGQPRSRRAGAVAARVESRAGLAATAEWYRAEGWL
jgi:nucleoside-diphosphate-sugar epimerase